MALSENQSPARHKGVVLVKKRGTALFLVLGLLSGYWSLSMAGRSYIALGQGTVPSIVRVLFVLLLAAFAFRMLYKSWQGLKLKRLAAELAEQTRGLERINLRALAALRKQSLERLTRDLCWLAEQGALPKRGIDAERQELVLDLDSFAPPLDEETQQRLLVKRERKSLLPVIMVAVFWLLYALVSPLYRLTDYAVGLLLAVVVYTAVARWEPTQTFYTEQPKPVTPPPSVQTGDEELDLFLQQAIKSMERLTALKMSIRKESMRDALQQMMNVAKEIFDIVKEQPQKMRVLRQFSNYYLPMSLSLLESYQDMEQQPEKGKTILESMRKIEEMTDTILEAFRRELDSLYEDKALDISAEIAVMKNLMQLDGPGKIDWENQESKEVDDKKGGREDGE